MSATAHAACRRFRSPANIFCCHRLVLQGSHHRHRPCSVSLNGSGGAFAVDQPVLIHETHTLPAVAVAESAVSQLNLAISALHADPPSTSSGIIRLEVPIMEKGAALDWLLAQRHLPRCYFSGRGQKRERDLDFIGISGNGHVCHDKEEKCLVSVAGVGSAVSFRGFDPFSLEDWNYIRRFLSKDCPLVRAYGAIRFDANRKISTEWKEFGSFYFIVPQVEFDEFEDVSMLAATIAWDDSLLLTWDEAVDRLQATMKQLLVRFDKLEKPQRTAIVGCCHVPSKALWNDSVTKALQIINKRNSDLVKVVLARCSRYVTDTVIDPLALLASLQVDGQNAYQFCIQPPNSPAFVGNTPEQLFHRKFLSISSEALAGTRSRGVTEIEDFQIGQDLLYSPKDDTEFTIVRDSIRRKLETICNEVIVDPSKGLRKLPGLQHICTEFFGKIRKEGDEFDILASLHPSPAVCGMPLEEARQFITEHEKFDRGMYAGPIGWFGGSESEFAVGIRSALVGQDLNTLVYAGAGIVKGTIPSLEWEEVDLKISQFTKLLHHHELQACLTEIKNPGNVASDD